MKYLGIPIKISLFSGNTARKFNSEPGSQLQPLIGRRPPGYQAQGSTDKVSDTANPDQRINFLETKSNIIQEATINHHSGNSAR